MAGVIDGHWLRKAAIDHQRAALAAIEVGGVVSVKSRDDSLALSLIDREKDGWITRVRH